MGVDGIDKADIFDEYFDDEYSDNKKITLDDLPKAEEHDRRWMETNICDVRDTILSMMKVNERHVQVVELHPKVLDTLRTNGFRVTQNKDSKIYTIEW